MNRCCREMSSSTHVQRRLAAVRCLLLVAGEGAGGTGGTAESSAMRAGSPLSVLRKDTLQRGHSRP